MANYQRKNKKNKWRSFERKNSPYVLEDLGRPAVFLIPVRKLRIRPDGNDTVERMIANFILENLGAFTISTVPSFGFWKNRESALILDECHQYEVSFPGKNGVSRLMEKLAEVARKADEECIYFKAGQYACLIYPKQK